MTRLTLPLAGLCVILGLLLWLQIERHAATRDALSEARAYIETRKETDDALSDLPDDPDGVLERLCQLAPTGPGCVDP